MEINRINLVKGPRDFRTGFTTMPMSKAMVAMFHLQKSEGLIQTRKNTPGHKVAGRLAEMKVGMEIKVSDTTINFYACLRPAVQSYNITM